MNSTCPICLENFDDKIKATLDVCDHIFCLLCISSWAKHGNFCPVDRKKYKKIINLSTGTPIQAKPRKRKRAKCLYDISVYCEICKNINSSNTLLLCCDSCDLAYHCECLRPPRKRIPKNRWFCPDCKAVEIRLKKSRAQATNPQHILQNEQPGTSSSSSSLDEDVFAKIKDSDFDDSSSDESAAESRSRIADNEYQQNQVSCADDDSFDVRDSDFDSSSHEEQLKEVSCADDDSFDFRDSDFDSSNEEQPKQDISTDDDSLNFEDFKFDDSSNGDNEKSQDNNTHQNQSSAASSTYDGNLNKSNNSSNLNLVNALEDTVQDSMKNTETVCSITNLSCTPSSENTFVGSDQNKNTEDSCSINNLVRDSDQNSQENTGTNSSIYFCNDASEYPDSIILKIPLQISLNKNKMAADSLDSSGGEPTISTFKRLSDISTSSFRILDVSSIKPEQFQNFQSGPVKTTDCISLSSRDSYNIPEESGNFVPIKNCNQIGGASALCEAPTAKTFPIPFSLVEKIDSELPHTKNMCATYSNGLAINSDKETQSSTSNLVCSEVRDVSKEKSLYQPRMPVLTKSGNAYSSVKSARDVSKEKSSHQPEMPVLTKSGSTYSSIKSVLSNNNIHSQTFTKKELYLFKQEDLENVSIPSDISHLFVRRIFIKDENGLSVRKDGSLFLNWKKNN